MLSQCIYALQVCFADILEVEGKATEEEFRKEYGVDRVFFVKCDVRKQGDLHSESKIDGWNLFPPTILYLRIQSLMSKPRIQYLSMITINSSWLSHTIWRHRTWSIVV